MTDTEEIDWSEVKAAFKDLNIRNLFKESCPECTRPVVAGKWLKMCEARDIRKCNWSEPLTIREREDATA